MTRKKSTETGSPIDKLKKSKATKDKTRKPAPGTGGGDMTTMGGTGGGQPPGEEE